MDLGLDHPSGVAPSPLTEPRRQHNAPPEGRASSCRGAVGSRWWSRPGSVRTPPSSSRYWKKSECPGWDRCVLVNGRTASPRTRHTATIPVATTCEGAASRTPFPRSQTPEQRAHEGAETAAGHQALTWSDTRSATRWSEPSANSSSRGRWPPDTTSAAMSSSAPSQLPRSLFGSGCDR